MKGIMLTIKLAFIFLISAVILSDNIGAQNIIPGEYIIKWKHEFAAREFAELQPKRRGEKGYQSQSIFKEKLYIEHVIVPPDLISMYEKIWSAHPDILYFQKNRKIDQRIIPDDPNFGLQWQYINNGTGGVVNADLDIDLAWDITTGGLTISGDTIVICVVDEGINLDHPDLKANLWVNHHEIPGNGIDDDNNGYVDDYKGWNVTAGNDNVSEGGSHGTPVCGIVGAKGNNGEGVSGVNWNVKIMFVKYGSASEANAIASYAYAYTMRKLYNESNGAKGAFVVVTNSSWGLSNVFAKDAPLWCDMYNILGEVGILSCGATANSDVDVDANGDLPTSCESEFLLSVTNMNRSDQKLAGAAYGARSIDLGAYGHQTYTTSRTSYAAFGGTSGATPHVAGTIALAYSVPCPILAEMTTLDPAKAALVVKDMILHGVVSNPTLEGITTTGGRLNTNRSIRLMESLCSNCSPPAGIVVNVVADTAVITWQNENANGVSAIRYRKTGEETWITKSGFQNGISLGGLEYCQEYELQISSSCDLQPPVFGYSKYFTSGGCCPAPYHFETLDQNGQISLIWEHDAQTGAEFVVKCADINGNIIETVVDSNLFLLGRVDSCRWFSISIEANCPVFGTSAEVVTDIIVNTPCGVCTSSDYCIFSKKNTKDEWINRVEFGDLKVTSGININGYGNYLGAMVKTFYRDSSYMLHIEPGFSANPFTEDYSVYIDYDQNGIFEATEKVWNQRTAATNGISTLLRIPAEASEGITRMRVIMAFQGHDSPCDLIDFEYGEVEDYCIRISPKPSSCAWRNEPFIDTIVPGKVSLNFTRIDSATRYVVLIKKSDTHLFDTLYVQESPFELQGLDSCSRYDVMSAPDCGSLVLNFSNQITFNSPCRTTAIDYFSGHGWHIYPNPSDHFFEIKGKMSGNVLFAIRDITGHLLWVEKDRIDNYHVVSWPDDVSPGVYILEIRTDTGVSLIKLMKSH